MHSPQESRGIESAESELVVFSKENTRCSQLAGVESRTFRTDNTKVRPCSYHSGERMKWSEESSCPKRSTAERLSNFGCAFEEWRSLSRCSRRSLASRGRSRGTTGTTSRSKGRTRTGRRRAKNETRTAASIERAGG